MKLHLLSFAIFIGVSHAGLVDQCTYGPSYWCSSIKAAKDCGALQHCMTATWKNNMPLQQDTNETCQFCETVVGEVRSMLLDQKTQDEIRKMLDSACSIIPSQSLSKECQDVVDNYLPEIIGIIAAELNPQMICSLMGLCKGVEDKVPHAELLKAPETVKLEPICTDCKKFFGDIKDLVTSETTEKQLEQLIDDLLCSELGTLEDECKQLVATFVPEILQMLAGQYDPDMICNAMGFCANATLAHTKTLLHRLKLQQSPLYHAASVATGSAETCVICETVLTELQTLSRDKAAQEEMKSLLKSQLCARLGSLKEACDKTIDTYAPIIFQLLADELDPKARCQSLGLCPANLKSNDVNEARQFSPVQKPMRPVGVKASAQCVLCEFVLKEVDGMLSDNATEAEIQAALEKVCSILPETIKDQCVDFVDTYSKAIIAMLAQELDPQQVCTALGLCKSTELKVTPYKPVSVRNDEMCGVCETVIQYIDALLEENSTISQIEAILDKVCNFLPKNIQPECENIVHTYGPAIVQLIAQYADPKEICQSLGLCQPSGQPVKEPVIQPSHNQLVGDNECTYGPAFWCASRENAERCKTVEHCKKHVWN